MKIKTIVENETGSFEIAADLTPEQHTFLLEFAVNELFRRGLMPFITANNESDLAKVAPTSETLQ